MADAWEDKIADAVAAELNDPARSWDALFNAEGTVAANARKAWFDLTEIATLKVTVVPATQERTRLARSNVREFGYGILIDLQRTLDPEDMTKIRALGTAAEEIQEWFDNAHELAGLTGWNCMEAVREDLFSLDQLYENRTWETLIALKVEGRR